MGKESKIQWCDHTFNIVWGCHKISEACKFCYAADFAKRVGYGKRLPTIWGEDAARRVFGDKHWREPQKWNLDAQSEGVRRRVFCSSMADVFEDHSTVADARVKLWPLIESTPWLDWMLLTKRPENMIRFAPESWAGRWPKNVWAGATAENQARLWERAAYLRRVPAVVRFLSCEPLLEALEFGVDVDSTSNRFGVFTCPRCKGWGAVRTSGGLSVDGHPFEQLCDHCSDGCAIDLVIVGGESGVHARPFALEWAKSIIDQCRAAGVAPFFKQAGEHAFNGGVRLTLRDRHGGDPAEWPEDLRVREMPGSP